MKHFFFSIFYVSLFLSLFLISCNRGIVIVSDIPSIGLLADAYNQKKNNELVQVYPLENATQFVNENHIDLLIINSLDQVDSTLLERLELQTVANSENDTDTLQILAYSLPLVIIRKTEDNSKFNSTRITLQELLTISKDGITQQNGIYHFGFYPIDESFESIFRNLEEKENWLIAASIGTKEIQQYFEDHYAPVPMTNRVLDTHIKYKYIASNTFFAMPLRIQNLFNIYLLENSAEKISSVSPVYLVKVRGGRLKLNLFLKWLYSTNGQKEIIAFEEDYYQDIHPPFLNNTLSTNWTTNILTLFNQNFWLFNNQPLLSQIQHY